MAQMRKEIRPYRLTCSPRYDPPRIYDLTRLPTLAKSGGMAWANDFVRLSNDERCVVVWRMVAQAARARARRAGRPDPIIYEATVKPLSGGGYVLDESTPPVPLRFEYGGDGRTIEDALREAKTAKVKDHVYIASLKLAQVAAKHKAQLEALGIKIVVEAPKQHDPGAIKMLKAIVPKPQRKAS